LARPKGVEPLTSAFEGNHKNGLPTRQPVANARQ
jgi:hypothetical protein